MIDSMVLFFELKDPKDLCKIISQDFFIKPEPKFAFCEKDTIYYISSMSLRIHHNIPTYAIFSTHYPPQGPFLICDEHGGTFGDLDSYKEGVLVKILRVRGFSDTILAGNKEMIGTKKFLIRIYCQGDICRNIFEKRTYIKLSSEDFDKIILLGHGVSYILRCGTLNNVLSRIIEKNCAIFVDFKMYAFQRRQTVYRHF